MRTFALWTSLVLCSLPVMAQGARADSKLWGVGTHLGGGQSDYETVDRLLRGLGATYRDDIYWRNLEQQPKEFVLPEGLRDLQKLVVQRGESDAKGLIVLDYGNPLYFPALPKSDADRKAYAAYVTWVARGWGRYVSGFEVWNEWNIGGGTDPREQGTPEDYIALLKVVRPVLNAEAPKVPVVCGALANREQAWVQGFGEKGGFAYCDGFSVHPYNMYARDASAEDVVHWLDALHKQIKQFTKKPISLWVTEIGWPNHDGAGGSAEVVTAQRLLKLNLLLATRGYLRGVWWYDLFDDGGDRAEREHNFGLVRQDLSRKPAYEAYQLFLRHFKDARYLKNTSTEHTIALEFKGKGQERLVAVWAREGKGSEYVSATGSWKLIPVPHGDHERVAAELKKGGSARLDAWPVLFELGKDANLKLSSKTMLGSLGCGAN